MILAYLFGSAVRSGGGSVACGSTSRLFRLVATTLDVFDSSGVSQHSSVPTGASSEHVATRRCRTGVAGRCPAGRVSLSNDFFHQHNHSRTVGGVLYFCVVKAHIQVRLRLGFETQRTLAVY